MVTLLVVIWMGGLKLWEWWVFFPFPFCLVNLVEEWVILWLGGLKL